MSRDDTMDGVESRMVDTDRLEIHCLEAGDPTDPTVLLLHGNVSSSRFFEPFIVEVSAFSHVLAPDLRGYGDTEAKSIDATRGLEPFRRDVAALLDELSIDDPVGIMGWSNGGGVAMDFLEHHPERVGGVLLQAPLSPYGFGGTKDLDGTACHEDSAGSGGGLANEEFVDALANDHRAADAETAPRTILRESYVAPEFEYDPAHEESYLTGMLDMAIGPDHYPGTLEESPNWPGIAPGDRGVNNAISPKYCDWSGVVALERKPPVVWVRGDADAIVADESLFDLGTLGRLGAVPDWPGEDAFPPQQMVGQTRAVLEEYESRGGDVTEVVLEGVGHSPHVEAPAAVLEHLRNLVTALD